MYSHRRLARLRTCHSHRHGGSKYGCGGAFSQGKWVRKRYGNDKGQQEKQ
jgi:hypothetical protein